MIAWPNDYPDLRTTLAPVPGADVFVSNRGSFASLRSPGYFLPTLRVESASGKSRPVLHPKIPHRARPLTAQVEASLDGAQPPRRKICPPKSAKRRENRELVLANLAGDRLA